jgi:outer membrane protein assembly factor BamB
MRAMKNQFPILLALGVLTGPLAAENWPEWRGPASNGAVAGKQPPLDLANHLLWKTELPGRGCSTPVVWDKQILVTSPVGDQDGLLAFDSDGKELWRQTFGALSPGRGQRVGSAANSSPVTDGEVVIAYFKSGTLACTDMAGKLKWQVNLQKLYGEDKLWWDQGTSPVLTPGRVVVAVMQTEGDSYLVSFDRLTGKEAWRTARKYDNAPESGDAYTTPHVIADGNGGHLVVTWGGGHLTAHDAATGKLVWDVDGFNPKREGMQRVIASAAVADGLALVPFRRGDSLAGISLDPKADPASRWLWRSDEVGSDSVTPILHAGKAYILKDGGPERGRLTCLDAKTGKKLWETKLPKAPQVYYSSPILAGDRFFCVREDGLLISAKVTDTGLADLTTHALEENVIASPVAIAGKLLIRTDKSLICFGEKP